MDMRKKSTKELTDLVLELHDSIGEGDGRDALMYSLALRVLEERGVNVRGKQ